MKAKGSKFAFFYFLLFFGIGTFQRVTSGKNKNFFPGAALASEVA
jgi:hypothetical protein